LYKQLQPVQICETLIIERMLQVNRRVASDDTFDPEKRRLKWKRSNGRFAPARQSTAF